MMRECGHEACGKVFEAKRADARFCSGSCRAAASRARRAGIGPESGPTGATAAAVESIDRAPADGADDERLVALENRVMDLESDVEAAETERDELQRLRTRVERAVASVEDLAAEARLKAEGAAKAFVAPIQKDLATVQVEAAKRSDLAELREAVDRVERRLATWDERLEATPMPDERLHELEQAVITLARRLTRLREEFARLVGALAAE